MVQRGEVLKRNVEIHVFGVLQDAALAEPTAVQSMKVDVHAVEPAEVGSGRKNQRQLHVSDERSHK